MEAGMGMADILVIPRVTIGRIKAMILFGKLTASGGRDFRRDVAIKMVRVAVAVCPVFLFAGHQLGLIAPVAGAGQ